MASITIPRDYFNTLLRRAELHKSPDDAITIPKVEHDALLKSAREYASLRSALISGGVSLENLEHLISAFILDGNSQDACPEVSVQEQDSETRWSAEAPDFVPSGNDQQTSAVSGNEARAQAGNLRCLSGLQSSSLSPDSYRFEDDKSSVTSSEKASPAEDVDEKSTPGQDKSRDRRSVILKGILDRTTLTNVANVIRGGQVLSLYLRPFERTAHVSFVDAIAAEAFVLYSKRADIYILAKRVEVSWDADNRQYFLPGHLNYRICQHGASRNLVIRFPKSDMTNDAIRADLDHIHLLEVLSVTFNNGSIFVSLNSIKNAIHARSCMSSRLRYKGSRIEFCADECAQPLPPIVKRFAYKPPPHAPVKQDFHNRFQMLAFDGVLEDPEDDEIDRLNRFEGIGRGDWTGQSLPG